MPVSGEEEGGTLLLQGELTALASAAALQVVDEILFGVKRCYCYCYCYFAGA